jgi:hypothetical protein
MAGFAVGNVAVAAAIRITQVQILGLQDFFIRDKAMEWSNKSTKKQKISELLQEEPYQNLKSSQIKYQLNSFIMSSQLRKMVGLRMSVATDAILEVTGGESPDPTTAHKLPFACDHTLLILSELHQQLNHESDGLPCVLPDLLVIFLRQCHDALERQLNGEEDTMPQDLQKGVDSIAVWIMCVVLPFYRDAWEELAMAETIAAKSQPSTIIGEVEYELNRRREAESNVGGACELCVCNV